MNNVKPAHPTKINVHIGLFIFLVAAISFSSRKWLKRLIKIISVSKIMNISNYFSELHKEWQCIQAIQILTI